MLSGFERPLLRKHLSAARNQALTPQRDSCCAVLLWSLGHQKLAVVAWMRMRCWRPSRAMIPRLTARICAEKRDAGTLAAFAKRLTCGADSVTWPAKRMLYRRVRFCRRMHAGPALHICASPLGGAGRRSIEYFRLSTVVVNNQGYDLDDVSATRPVIRPRSRQHAQQSSP